MGLPMMSCLTTHLSTAAVSDALGTSTTPSSSASTSPPDKHGVMGGKDARVSYDTDCPGTGNAAEPVSPSFISHNFGLARAKARFEVSSSNCKANTSCISGISGIYI